MNEETTYPKAIQMWETSDGKTYRNESSAKDHEQDIANQAKANLALGEGMSVAEALRAANYLGHIPPVLERINRETKLIIEYWQCRKEPGYQPRAFADDMTIMVHGNAGSWSGPYGNFMTIRELARYAEQTELSLGCNFVLQPTQP